MADLHVPDHGRWRWGERCAHRRRGTRRPRGGGRRRRRGQRCRRRCRRWNKRHRRWVEHLRRPGRRRRIPDLGRRRRVGLLGEWRIGLTRHRRRWRWHGESRLRRRWRRWWLLRRRWWGGRHLRRRGWRRIGLRTERHRLHDGDPCRKREGAHWLLTGQRAHRHGVRHTGLRRIAHVLGHLRRVHLGRRAERPRRCALVQLGQPPSRRRVVGPQRLWRPDERDLRHRLPPAVDRREPGPVAGDGHRHAALRRYARLFGHLLGLRQRAGELGRRRLPRLQHQRRSDEPDRTRLLDQRLFGAQRGELRDQLHLRDTHRRPGALHLERWGGHLHRRDGRVLHGDDRPALPDGRHAHRDRRTAERRHLRRQRQRNRHTQRHAGHRPGEGLRPHHPGAQRDQPRCTADLRAHGRRGTDDHECGEHHVHGGDERQLHRHHRP